MVTNNKHEYNHCLRSLPETREPIQRNNDWDYQKIKIPDYYKNISKMFEVQELEDILYKLENVTKYKEAIKYFFNLWPKYNDYDNQIKSNPLSFEFQIPINNWEDNKFFMNKKIYFINSHCKNQLEWLEDIMEKNKDNILIVSLYENPVYVSKRLQKNVYFDRDGELAKRFHIIGLPAIIEQKESLIIVKEHLLYRDKPLKAKLSY